MPKKILIFGISTLIFLGVFFIFRPAFADEVIIDNSGWDWPAQEETASYSNYRVFQTFKPTTDFSITKISIRFAFGGGNRSGSNQMSIYQDTTFLATSTNTISNTELPSFPTFDIFDYDFSSINLQKDVVYNFRIIPSVSDDSVFVLASNNNSYANGCVGGGNSSEYPTCDSRNIDAWFKIYSAPSNTLAIPFPANESTTADFWAFKLTFNAPNTYGYPLPSSPALNLQICYGTSQGEVANCQNSTSTWPYLQIDGNLYPNLIPGTPWDVYLHKTYQLASSTTYYAKAFMFNIAGTPLAESPQIAFTISGEPYQYNEPGIITPPTATSTSAEWTMTCDESSGFFQYSICYVFQYLFKPDPYVLGKWENIKILLENKPPLGYFILTKNALSGIATSTPAFNLAQASAVNENIFNPLKTGLTFILYLLFGIWLFKRIAHLEL